MLNVLLSNRYVAAAVVALIVSYAVTLYLMHTAITEANDSSLGLAQRTAGRFQRIMDRLIARAGWRITASELGIGWAVLIAAVTAWAAVSTQPAFLKGMIVTAALVSVPAFAYFSSIKTARDFERQFGIAMPVIAADIKAGSSVMSALQAITLSVDEPLRSTLLRMCRRVEGGMAPEDSLDEMARETGSIDVQLLATAVSVQQNHGGSVVSVIDRIGKTVAERQELRRLVAIKSASATSTMRFVTVAALAFVIVPGLYTEQGQAFYAKPIGWITIVVIVALLVVANLLAKRQRDSIM